MLATDTLLILKLSPLIACLCGLFGDVSASPRSAISRRQSELIPGMTCNQLQNYYSSLGAGTAPSNSDWDALDVSTFFNSWAESGNHFPFQQAFAREWGVGDTWENCRVETECSNVDCSSLGDAADLPDSAAAYLVLRSMSHFQQRISSLYYDIETAYNRWDRTDASLVANFGTDTFDDGQNIITTKIVLSAVTAAVVTAAIPIGPLTAAGANAAAGLAAGLNAAFVPPTNPEIPDLAALQAAINETVAPATGQVAYMFNSYRDLGNYRDNVFLTDLFANGAYVDQNTFPDTSTRQEVIVKHINALALNWAWHKTRCWVASFPMSQADFDDGEWYNGNGDSRLRWYDPASQRGFFMMSVWRESESFNQNKPTVQNPPGWADVGDLGFNTWQIMQSSWGGFQEAGFDGGFQAEAYLESLSDSSNTVDAMTLSLNANGVFTIVQCPFDSGFTENPTLDNFKATLSGPGAYSSNNDNGQVPSLCFCRDVRDKNGAVAQDFIDIDSWFETCGVTRAHYE